ncbi:hypothetical protein [Alicyclobacillus sp. ALC3]|uniref:hypothetical protein n=1 Tax=Alicyclobacillus sp. ALC3 TaxID=2796143 RepID=UPI00237813F6|nr:hypothetical protein [Alicyclobacillus sp. ALC3]WDL97815.1 hypothetical protein JC200_03530 [Alicyclobacillus sp. ALC3]
MLAATRKIEIEIYADLGLPRVDRTATRRAVRAYFGVYRQKRLRLSMDIVPHAEPSKARRGYEDAMDPDDIHVSRVYSSAPRGGSTVVRPEADGTWRVVTEQDRRDRAFCEDVERRVDHLPAYQRDIITHQYMTPDTPGSRDGRRPSDIATHRHLRDSGWYVGETYYQEEKAKAVLTLAEAFRIVQFETC